MVSYRKLTEDDCEFILEHWVGNSAVFSKANMTKAQLWQMIQHMNSQKYNGNYYEMFGILNEDILVGTFSFYQRDCDLEAEAVCLGVEIDVNNRRQGFATSAVLMSLEIAKEKGFEKMVSQARTYNIASVNLHKKCGFKIVEKVINVRGHEVYNFEYVLADKHQC